MNENTNAEEALLKGYNVHFDASTLSLSLDAMLEYVGKSADGNFNDDFVLGMQCILKFLARLLSSDFDTGKVQHIGLISNRLVEWMEISILLEVVPLDDPMTMSI